MDTLEAVKPLHVHGVKVRRLCSHAAVCLVTVTHPAAGHDVGAPSASVRIFPQTVYCKVLSYKKKGWPRYALAPSPELVRQVSAIVRLAPRLHTVSACVP